MSKIGNNLKLLIISLAIILVGSGLIWLGAMQGLEPSALPEIEKRAEFPTPSASLGISGQEVLVIKVIDGDTVEIEGGLRVRYIGIDTPETVDPRRPVGCFGREASAENKRLVEGKRIILVKDISATDRFNRLLRYAYLEQGDNQNLFVNDYLVRYGFAKAVTFPPDVRFSDQFIEAEREARSKQRGLWKEC